VADLLDGLETDAEQRKELLPSSTKSATESTSW